MMRNHAVTAVSSVQLATGCSPQAILDAARICGIPIIGGLLGRGPEDLGIPFYQEVFTLDAMHKRAAQRKQAA